MIQSKASLPNDIAPTNHGLDGRSLMLRRTVIDMLKASRRGHLGASFSIMEIMRVLYDDILRLDPKYPDWPERDRCILSKGHGCLALYVMLAEKGFFQREELFRFCSHDGTLGGHPDSNKIPGVEVSTGALGHGLSIGAGMAISARWDKSPRKIYIVVGDGECNEGSIWEAALSIGNRRLDNLCVLVDYNKYQSYEKTSVVQNLEPLCDKWTSFGFSVIEVDGHDISQLRDCLRSLPNMKNRPSLVICHTVKGKGVRFAENNLSWHHKSCIDDNQIEALQKALEE
jgi:transketolase